MVKVTCSKFMVPSEKPCHKELIYAKYESPTSQHKRIMANVKVFQK